LPESLLSIADESEMIDSGGYEMKRTILSLVCGALIVTGAIPATGLAAKKAAQAPARKTPAINERQHNQQERIRQGIKSGELTRREAVRLEKEEARIRANERRAKSDGKVTAAERARLEKELNKASQDIHEQKHDEQDRN
jgi:uncharacterized membrane protein YebE (DUF533 family)